MVHRLGWNYFHQGLRQDITGTLYDNRARMYSPTLMRFLQNDPLGYGAGDANTYRYEGNGPTGGSDPGGEQPPPLTPEAWLLQKKNVADRYDRIDTYWDQTYAAAGIAVVGALKQMALSVGEQFAKAAFERIGGAAAGKFIDFLVETRGWKLITDKAGKVVKILSKEGTEIEATVMRHELAHAEAAYAKQFVLGIYKDVQGTRGVSAAHHGVMSAWMNGHYGKAYDKFLAPAIQMPEAFHEATKGLANAWMAETKKKMGGTLNWANIGFSEMKDLSEKMFDVAGVPASVRKRYWEAFNPFHERLQLP